MDCIFCGIIHGEVESNVVYEDGEVMAFLDANPISKGHTLVLPKRHVERLTDLDEGTTSRLFNAVREVSGAIQHSLGPPGINVLQNNGKTAGQEVSHVHVHVIPRYGREGFEVNWTSIELESEEALEITGKIRRRLGR